MRTWLGGVSMLKQRAQRTRVSKPVIHDRCSGWTANRERCPNRAGALTNPEERWCGECRYPPDSAVSALLARNQETLPAQEHLQCLAKQLSALVPDHYGDLSKHTGHLSHQGSPYYQLRARHRHLRHDTCDASINALLRLPTWVAGRQGGNPRWNGESSLPGDWLLLDERSVTCVPVAGWTAPRSVTTFTPEVVTMAHRYVQEAGYPTHLSSSDGAGQLIGCFNDPGGGDRRMSRVVSDFSRSLPHPTSLVEAGLVNPTTGHVRIPEQLPTRGGVAVLSVEHLEWALATLPRTALCDKPGGEWHEPASNVLHITGSANGTPLLYLVYSRERDWVFSANCVLPGQWVFDATEAEWVRAWQHDTACPTTTNTG